MPSERFGGSIKESGLAIMVECVQAGFCQNGRGAFKSSSELQLLLSKLSWHLLLTEGLTFVSKPMPRYPKDVLCRRQSANDIDYKIDKSNGRYETNRYFIATMILHCYLILIVWCIAFWKRRIIAFIVEQVYQISEALDWDIILKRHSWQLIL